MILFQTMELEEQKLSEDRKESRSGRDPRYAPKRDRLGFLESFELMFALYSEQVLRGLR